MTSTNDGKDVKSNQTSGQKGKTYYIELYKSLEARLTGECSGEERTRHVCEAWRRVHCLCLHSAPSTHLHLLSWIQRHTSHTILQTEWQSPKSKEQHTWLEEAINAFIAECKDAVSKRDGVTQPWESQLLQRASWFLTALPNPWGHPVLKALLDSRGPQPSDREVLQWLKEERGVMFVTRLRQLAASKCDDLALLLATAVMNHVRHSTRIVADVDQAEEQPQDKPEAINDLSFHSILRKEAGFTTDVWELLIDIEFVLLYKGESRARCIELAKQTPLRNGYKLVERLHNRLENSPQEKKLWKNAKDVATLIAQVVIARCMVVPHCTGVARAALYGCVYSLVQLLPADKLPTAAAALAAPAATSRHLHTLAAAVNAQCTEERKPFVCSLYVRAITAGMNELEKLKLDTEKASEARAIEQTLASWFIQLGALLSASSRLSCECTLTAFSVHPSPTMYDRVKRAPPLAPLIMPDIQEQDTETNSEYGSWATDSRTQTNLVKTSETLKLKQTQKQANVLSTAIFAEGEGLGLEADLCQDLAVLLSGPRVKTLYWDMDREVLLENCRTYMERTHGGTRALTTELKYLNLDPNCFQHLPEEADEDENDIYYGIEKGYEHLVEFEEPEPEDVMCDDIMTDYSETTDSLTSIEELPMLIPKRKKKKNKQPQIFSEEEVDPLSLVCDTFSENKDIPHSKERSKHKSKERSKSKIKIDHTKEHDENNGISDEITKEIETKVKKKQKKERKKKDKLSVCDIKTQDHKYQSSSNLSKLVGMKIANSNVGEIERQNMNPNVNACTTDSDYDSQGKSSINSEYNENALNEALNEALHSMDDIKSSAKTLTDDLKRTSFPPNSYTPTTITTVKEGVTRSIQKLIEYRRHNVLNDNSTSRDSSGSYSHRYSIDHDFLKSKKLSNNTNSSVTDTEGVKCLDTTHAPVKHHMAVKNESSNITMPSNEGSFNSKKKTLNLSLQMTKDKQGMLANEKSTKKKEPRILKPKSTSQMIKQTVNKINETPSQKQYQEFLLQRKCIATQDPILTSESLGQVQFQEFLKKQYLQSNEPSASTSLVQDLPKQLPSQPIKKNVTPSQVQFHNFLKELQETINAGATNENRDLKCIQALHDKAATKKIIQTKKVDNATNTYARLSYMHKNKQCESKLKVAHNPIIQNKPLVNVTPEKIGHIKDIDVEKMSYLQSKGEIVLSKIVKPKNKCSVEKAKVLVQNIESIGDCSTSINNPLNKTGLSNLLPSGNNITDYTEPGKTEIEMTKQCNMPTPKTSTSFLSEKDQFDLLLLLRQQNKMNPPKIPIKTEIPNTPSGILIKTSSSHCVNSEKKCSDLHNKIPILEVAKSTSCPTSVIKVTNSKSLNNGSDSKKNRAKGSKQKINIESDWKSVMDDLLAHKTPSMIGPNALDVVLKKDSFEKRSSECLNNPNCKSVITSCINKTKIINNENIAKHFTQDTQTASTSTDSSFNLKSAHTENLKVEQDVVQSTNKIRSVDIEKKRPTLIQNKHFPSVIQNSYDPFISGIPNSDYDLLEELMDDDLRQEIGELSSDEDSYRNPNLSTFKTKTNLHTKESNLPITKTNATSAGNPFNLSSTSHSDSVKKCSTNAVTIVKKDLSLKSSSLPKEIIRKNLDSNNCANLKPQIISNELITSSTLVKKPSPSGKVCNNIFGTTMKAVTSNTTKLCVEKAPHLKINPVITTSKMKSQNPNKMSANICSDSNLFKTAGNNKVLINSVPTDCKVQNVLDPAQVVLTVPQRNTQAQAQNIMLIGSKDLIYDPFTTIHQSTKSGTFSDLNKNTYVTVNQAPMNVTLLHSTPFVGPVLSPVIIENSVTLPIIQKVAPNMSTNFTLLNSKNPEPSSICKNIQHLNKIKAVTMQSKTSNERHEKHCRPVEEDLEAFKLKGITSKSSAAHSEMSTSKSMSKKGKIIAEMTDLKQSQPGTVKSLNLDTKPESKVSEDKKCPVNERSGMNELVDKTLSLDNKSDILLDQERIKNKPLVISEKLENLKNTSYHEKPIVLPSVPMKSSKQYKKKLEITDKGENQHNHRTRRKISDKTDSCQKQCYDRPTVFNDDAVIAQISKKVNKAKAIQNLVKNNCLSKDKNVPIIQNKKSFNSNFGENNYFVKRKCEHKLNMEFKKSNNDTHYDCTDKQQNFCKENIGELKESDILLNDHVEKAIENDISLKSVNIQTFSAIKNSCHNLNIPTKTNDSSELSNCDNIFKECGKEEPSIKDVGVSENNNKCILRKLTSQQHNVSVNLTRQKKIPHKEIKKAKISKSSSHIEKLLNDCVETKWVDIEEQILPVVIKSKSIKSDALHDDKIKLICDNNMTHDQNMTPVISIKKSDEAGQDLLCVSNITHDQTASLVISQNCTIKKSNELGKDFDGVNNATHDQIASPVISQNCTIKKSDELCKDFVGVNSTTHDQIASPVISQNCTIKISDELCKDKISLIGESIAQHDQKASPVISQNCTIKKSDELFKNKISLIGESNAQHDQKASPEISQNCTIKKSDELCKDKISLVGDSNATHDQIASPVTSENCTINKSDKLCKDKISSIGESNAQHDQIASPVISQNCTFKTSEELYKDKISLTGDSNMTHVLEESALMSQNCVMKKFDELCEDFVGVNNTVHDQIASPVISQKYSLKKPDVLCKEEISLVCDSNTTRGQKAPPLILQNCTLKNSDILGKGEISMIADFNSTHNQKASLISENYKIEKSDELCKDKFSMIGDNTTTQDKKQSLLKSQNSKFSMIGDNTTTQDKKQSLLKSQNSSTKKADLLCKDNISLVVDNNEHDQTRTLLICQNSALTKSDEISKDNILSSGSGNITHSQHQKASLSQSNTIKNSDELVNDKHTSLGNNFKPHEKRVPYSISQSMRVKDNDIGNKSIAQEKPTVASNGKKIVQEILGTKKLDINAEMQRGQGNNSNSTIKTVTNTLPETVEHRELFKDVRNNKGSLNLQNDQCKSKNTNLLNAKITYDELPNLSNGPQKRCVRIKLANGNSFKATISGKSYVSIDSIFEDPTVKSLLLQNINNNTKCTLNIRQSVISLQNKNEPPILKNVVKSIICPQNEAETINLISDDEEDTHPQSFKTEFGTFNVKFLDPNIHLKHQRKLSQKSVVLLERYNVMKETVPNEKNIESNKLDKENIPSEKPTSTPETVTDYIEIDDDSSNDSITLVSVTNINENNKTTLCREKVDELKNLLLKDLGVEINDMMPKRVLNKTQEIVKNPDKIIKDSKIQKETLNLLNEFTKNIEDINQSTDIQTEALNIINEMNRNFKVFNKNIDIRDENKSNMEENNRIESEKDLPVRQIENISKQVLLKIKKCDDLIEQLKIKKQQCFVSLIRCDDALKDYERKFESCTDNEETDESLQDAVCLRNEITIAAEASLKRSDSESILNALGANAVDLSLSTNNQDLSDPMSPSLIDNFDIPVNLDDNILNSSDILVGLSNKVCDADWFMTKSFLNKHKSLDNPYRVSLEIFKKCETDEDSLTDCDSDLDVSLSRNESSQVPSLVKLIVNLLANDPHVLERHIDKDLKSENGRNTNSSPLKRKANEFVEVRPQSKISKMGNHFDSEILFQSKRNCHSNDNTRTQTEYASKSKNSKDVLELDCKIKGKIIESRSQSCEVLYEIQNDVVHMKYQEVASLLQIAIKSFQVMSEIKENLTCVEDISCSSNSIRTLPINVNDDFCFDKTSANNATVPLKLKVKNVDDGSILRTRETLSKGEELKTTCSFDVSEDAIVYHSEINENTSNREHILKNRDTCTDLQSNGEDDMQARSFVDDENNAEPCLILTKTRLPSQPKMNMKTCVHTAKSVESAYIISEMKENGNYCIYNDTEDSIHMKGTAKAYDTETQTDTSTVNILKNQPTVDDLKKNKKGNSEYSVENDTKLPETGSTLLSNSDVHDVNGTLRRPNFGLDVDVRTRENDAKTKLNEENTKIFITLGELGVTEMKTVDNVGSKVISKLKMDQAWNAKNSTCSEYENLKPCSLVKTTDNSHKDLVSSHDLTPDLNLQDAFKQNEHGIVFDSTTNSNKVTDYDGRNTLEMTVTSSFVDDTQEQDTDENYTAYMKNKVNAENQENKLIAFAMNIEKPIAPEQQVKLSNSKLGLEPDIFVNKSLIDIEVKQSEICATHEVHVGTTNSAQDTKLLDKTKLFINTQFKNDHYSHEDCVNVTLKDLETLTQTSETELHQKFDILEDKISPCSLKELEIKIASNSKIKENDTCADDKHTSLKTLQLAESNEISHDTCISKEVDETLKLAENIIIGTEISDSDTTINKEKDGIKLAEYNVIQTEFSDSISCINEEIDTTLKLAENNISDAEISESETSTSKETDETSKLVENNSTDAEISDSDVVISKKIDEALKLAENIIIGTEHSDSDTTINKEKDGIKLAEYNVIQNKFSDSISCINEEIDTTLKLDENNISDAEILESETSTSKETDETSKLAENNSTDAEISDSDVVISKKIDETLKQAENNIIETEISDSVTCINKQFGKTLKLLKKNITDAEISDNDTSIRKEIYETLKLAYNNSIDVEISDSDTIISKEIDETLKLAENNIETEISDSGTCINKELGITLKIAENNIIGAEISDSDTSIIQETDKLFKLAESNSINAEILDSDTKINNEIEETSKLAENNSIETEILVSDTYIKKEVDISLKLAENSITNSKISDSDTSISKEINGTLKLCENNVIGVEISDSDYCKTKYTTNENRSSNNSESIQINDIKSDAEDKFDDNNLDVSITLANNKCIDDEILKGDQYSEVVFNTYNKRNLETASHETNTALSAINCNPQEQVDNTFGLNPRINMKNDFINFHLNENINLIDHNKDMRPLENLKSEIIQSKTSRKKRFDECFPDNKSECVRRKKATNGDADLEETIQCNVLSKNLQFMSKMTNSDVNGSEDIGNSTNRTSPKKDDITYESNEYTTPDTNNINENNETEKTPAHTNNQVSSNEKRMDNFRCKPVDSIFQNHRDFNENSEGNFVNSEKNLTKELTASENADKVESSSSNDNKLQKNVTLVYKGDSNIILKGSIYEDPLVGICYVFPALNRTLTTADEMNCSNMSDDKTVNAMTKINSDVFEDSNKLDVSEDVQITENFNVVLPKVTYSRQRFKNNENINIGDKTNRKNLKRKYSCYENKFHAKRYRKGKNIDYPKFSVVTVLESAYSREYKRLLDYCTSVKFSYSRNFHKEYIDVSDILKGWPIKETDMNVPDNTEFENTLFSEEQFENKAPLDPLQQTLAEEISQCNEHQYTSCDINETNFNMGFGEGSDRVIQISEDGNNMSEVSAATLSDVKQSQPCLTSEEYGNCDKNLMICASHKHQIEILKRSISYIKLRDKVRSFFKKTTAELNYHWLMDTMKSKYKKSCNNSIFLSGFPYDLISSDFIEPPPVEAVVQVVQVGQLPVSAAAQNPVTCDPRVTQVTDASPQCSIENGPHDDSQSPIKTEYTELTTADLSLPLVHDYDRHMETQESSKMTNSHHEDIPVETEITSIVKTEITVELSPLKEEPIDYNDSDDLQSLVNKHINNVDYSFDSNDNSVLETQSNTDISYESLENHEIDFSPQEKQQSCSPEKTDQIAHAMNAAGITTTPETNVNTRTHSLVNMLPQKNCQEAPVVTTAPSVNNFSKNPVNAMTLQQALAQILPPPLNQTNVHENNQTNSNSSVTSQVLHIVQGKNTNGNQITLVDNSPNSVISNNNTPVLHIVQNKGASTNTTSNTNSGQHANSYSGLSLVDAGIQQGSNQLLHIVNTGNQKNNSPGQILKRVNLLTNLTNVQGSNEQKMVQFVCKSADGKSIHLNAPHQRSMVLRLQPIESANIQTNQKATECQDNTSSCPTSNTNNASLNKESSNAQHEIKSRSVYEENYAKFIQNSSNKSVEKSTSLPKFGQAFGKQVFQDGNQGKGNDINANNSNLSSINSNSESSECQASDNSVNLDHIGQINSPPLLLRKSPSQPAQSQSSQANLVQQIKQTIAPMNIQTMHGGVIYTRQIPVNIGGGQTINLITVPSTELIDEANQKQKGDVKFVNQNELDSPIIKIVPQNQSTANAEGTHDDTNNNSGMPNENAQNTPAQHQTVLTQMRIKLPMLSKTPQMVSGARVVRPSFFQIQRNVIGGANQHVYQQLVLTAAPPLGQHTIRLPQAQANRQTTKTADGQAASEPQMSSSTLEQLREFDMVLEQVKERSTVQPNSNSNSTFTKMLTPTTEASEGTSVTSTVTESTQQVLYSIGSNQSLNVAYINRKTIATTPTTSTFVRSPDSTGIIDTPSSSHVQIPHTVTSESTNEASSQPSQPKPAKVGSKSKSRPKSSSNPPNSLKINTLPPKPTQKPLEDEQTTQRILYILAEYKEQVENSPDKDKPAPRRRSNPPTTSSGSSKRKKSSSGSRRPGARDMSPVHGEDTCRTMGSEDSSCGTSQGDCNESCLDSHSPQDSPRKVVRKLTFENETSPVAQPRPQPQRNVIVADGQTITVARGAAGKPATAVLMPANYILPVSMVKGGQQIAIVTNRGPKLLTVGGGEGGATNALLLQRLIGPAGLKPVLTRPGVRHVRLPTAALHNLQAFNLTTATAAPPPDSTASPAPAPTPPELIETRANSSPWTDRESHDVKPERESSPEGSEPWNLPSSADPHDYTYEETVRTDNMDRTVLVVHKKDGTSQRHHRLTHVSAAALRHKYAILEHELRLQKSLSEECEDLGVDSPSASELFPEAELLFAASPAHDAPHHPHTPQPTILNQSGIPQPDIDDQIATDELLQQDVHEDQQELDVSTLGLDEGIVTVSEDGMQATIALDQEEFARSHPNTTFHSEPTDEGEVQPFTIAGLKGRHITSTIFHAGRAPATVLVTAPQTTVISQATPDHGMPNNVKYANMDHIINSSPVTHGNLNLSSVLVKDDGLTKFDNILTDSRELHLSNTASAIVHSTGNATQVIRRVCYEDDKRDTRFLMDEPDALIAGDDAKMIAEDSSRDATLVSIAGDVDDDNSSPERHAELFWESNSASERSESRRPMDFSSDSEKCCKSPSYDETNSTDSSGVGTHMRLDSVIKDARGIERSGSADGSSADDTHPPLRTYPAKRMYHALDGEVERSMSGKTRAGERSPDSLEVRRRASGRGVVKRGCHCCTGSPAPPRPKKPRQRKPAMDFTN